MDPSELCPNLLKWLSTFDDCQHVSIPEDISSGVIVANVLHQIEPVWFSQSWLEKINTDAGDNWRLKARNLKKVSQAIVDYLGDNLEFDVSHLSQPEPNKLAEQADHEEAARLVQLVLGVAINCPRKQEFIEAIRMLEPSVQTVLMTAIQQLMTSSASVVSAGQPDSCNSWLAEASRLTHELQLACDERDALTQRCFEQERQLQLLQSDKVAAQAELHQLQTRLGESVRSRQTTADPAGEAVLPPGGDRYKQLRVKLDAAHDEIYRLETSRDELKSKYEECNRELSETRTRADELQRTADESRGLKDELDILREKSIKVSQYESSLETYKRRLQEMSDLRGQIRVLELKNAEYVQINCELEEEVAKSGCYRPQLDIYKQRVAELNEQLTEKNTRLDWLESERRILAEKLATIQQERDRVIEDRNRMKETLEELCLSQFAQQSNHAVNSSVSSHASVGPPLQQSKLDILSNVPAEIRDQMLAIRHESGLMSRYECSDSPNEIISDTVDTGDAYRQLVAGFKKCHSLQLLELRRHKQRVMELDSKLARSVSSGDVVDGDHQLSGDTRQSQILGLEQELRSKTMQMGEMEIHINAQAARCRELEEQLAKRGLEMSAMEERYKKYLEKAKAVVRSLDSKVNPTDVASIDVGVLRYQLAEKEKMVEMLEKDNERFKSISASEQKLMSTAFHNIGMKLHRHAMEHRLNLVGYEQQSFLTKNRKASIRRPHGNSDFYD